MSTLLTDPKAIMVYNMARLRTALKLEIAGMRVSRGQTAYAMIKERFGLKGSKQKVYDQFSAMVEEYKSSYITRKDGE